MATIRPFKGLRVAPALAPRVATPPYDTLSGTEARELAEGKPYSFLLIDRPDIEFPDNYDPYDETVYTLGRENLDRFMGNKTFIQDSQPCFYLYRLTMNGRKQTGLVALTSVEEYDNGIVKKHEHTRPEKVKDRANHIIACRAQVSPVLSTFKQDPTIAEIFRKISASKSVVDFRSDDDVNHEFWVVNDIETIKALIEAFAKLPLLYIADGHHRCEAASDVARQMRDENPRHTGDEPYNYFLNGLFADSGLHIMPYNRVIRDTNGLTPEALLERVKEKFDLKLSSVAVTPTKPHQFGLYCEKQWYLLNAKEGSFDANHHTKSIDTAILADNLISPVLGIHNQRTDKRIDFVGGIRGTAELVRLVDSGDFSLAFSLYPTSIEQLLRVADAGEVMPPKSTWFEPKLRSGLIVHLLAE